MITLASISLVALLAAAAPAEPVTDCDRLAANPEDPDRIAPPVPREQADLPKAIAACEAEVAKNPGNARARYQLARVLFYADQTKRALEEMKKAADANYRQAQFVYGLLIDNKRPDAPSDICIAEQYWLKSARAGRQAARVSYVRHVVKNKFAACKLGAAPGELEQFLDAAAAESDNYYQRLLIEDLNEQLALRSTRGGEHT
jgi:hypothetical protein